MEEVARVSGLTPGVYRHFKGNLYELLCVATHSETLERMVVYRQLYGDGGVWVRPASMWDEPVTRGGITVPRFAPADAQEPLDVSADNAGDSQPK